MKKHFYLVINGQAGSGQGRKAAKVVVKTLQEQNISYTTFYTDYPGHEAVIVRELAETTLQNWSATKPDEPFPLLVILGGDGTLHEALNAVASISATIPIGYLPCGSGNDFARGLKIARQTEKALKHLLRVREPKALPVIHYHDDVQGITGLAMNNVGIGLDAAIAQATNESHTKKTLNQMKLGALAYVVAIFKRLLRQKSFPIRAEINGQTYNFPKAFLCSVMNHPYIGGGIPLVPTATLATATFNFVLVERVALWKIAWLLGLLTRKKHLHSRYLTYIESTHLRIFSTVPQLMHTDGEIIATQGLAITFQVKKQLFWV